MGWNDAFKLIVYWCIAIFMVDWFCDLVIIAITGGK